MFGWATVTVASPDIEISIIALLDDEGKHSASEISGTIGTLALQLAVAWSTLTSVIQGASVVGRCLAHRRGHAVGKLIVLQLCSDGSGAVDLHRRK